MNSYAKTNRWVFKCFANVSKLKRKTSNQQAKHSTYWVQPQLKIQGTWQTFSLISRMGEWMSPRYRKAIWRLFILELTSSLLHHSALPGVHCHLVGRSELGNRGQDLVGSNCIFHNLKIQTLRWWSRKTINKLQLLSITNRLKLWECTRISFSDHSQNFHVLSDGIQAFVALNIVII